MNLRGKRWILILYRDSNNDVSARIYGTRNFIYLLLVASLLKHIFQNIIMTIAMKQHFNRTAFVLFILFTVRCNLWQSVGIPLNHVHGYSSPVNTTINCDIWRSRLNTHKIKTLNSKDMVLVLNSLENMGSHQQLRFSTPYKRFLNPLDICIKVSLNKPYVT